MNLGRRESHKTSKDIDWSGLLRMGNNVRLPQRVRSSSAHLMSCACKLGGNTEPTADSKSWVEEPVKRGAMTRPVQAGRLSGRANQGTELQGFHSATAGPEARLASWAAQIHL